MTPDRFPNVKFILSHAGGTVPYFAWRLAASPRFDPSLPQSPREKFENALRHFWYDSALSCGPATIVVAALRYPHMRRSPSSDVLACIIATRERLCLR